MKRSFSSNEETSGLSLDAATFSTQSALVTSMWVQGKFRAAPILLLFILHLLTTSTLNLHRLMKQWAADGLTFLLLLLVGSTQPLLSGTWPSTREITASEHREFNVFFAERSRGFDPFMTPMAPYPHALRFGAPTPSAAACFQMCPAIYSCTPETPVLRAKSGMPVYDT